MKIYLMHQTHTDIGYTDRQEKIVKYHIDYLKQAISINADIYHFHDPELISVGYKLIKKGKKVVYDVHEDVPRQILNKYYLSPFIRKIIANLFESYENRKSKKFTYIYIF